MLLEMNWNSKELMKLNLICPSSPVTIQQSLTPLSSHSLSAPKRNNKYWPVVQLMENTFPRTRTRTSGPVLRISMIGFGCLLQMHALSSGWRRVIGNICFFQFELKFLSHKFVPDTIAKFSADSPYPLDPRTHRIWTGIKFHLFYALCFIQFSILCFYVLYVLILIPFLWFPRTIEWTDHSIGSPISLDSLRKRMSSPAQEAI